MNRGLLFRIMASALILAGGILMAQEDCIGFNPATTEAKLVSGNWKIVDGSHWIMDFGSNRAEAEKAERIIKHYKMTAQCFVGRPNAPMKYFKTQDGVPVGPFPGEDAIKFDPAKVEAKEIAGHWKVVQGAMWMLDFGDSETNARKAVKIIKENGFQYQCFVGRPDAPMMYFRKDAAPAVVETASEDCIAFNPEQVEAMRVGSNWKVVHGNMLMMDFGASKAEAETAVRIIKHYKMSQQCFVGRPDAPMMYFKTREGVPVGPFPGEDAIRFDPAQVEAKKVGANWKVVQGSMWLLDFGGSEANARKAVAVIRENGFQYQCFVGRPNAPMMYFRKDAAVEAAAEDCIPFNPEQVEVMRTGSNWKVVHGNMLMMDFGANREEAELAVRIIKHYRMSQQCFVGRPNAPMQYFKTQDGIPTGPFPGEDAIKFNPAQIEAKKVGANWKVVQGSMWMLDFGGSEANARKAVAVIKENGFQYQCFVGRPNAPMMYFRKDAAPGAADAVSEDCIAFNPDQVQTKLVGSKWKVVQGSMWLLDFGANRAKAERAEKIIKHYQMTQQCFVGRPNAPMMYFKTRDGVPVGPFPGEDAIKFNPAQVEAKKVNSNWKVAQGSMWLLDFGSSEANARKAVAVIKENGFQYQCFVGRPNAPMMYFRKDGAPVVTAVEECSGFKPDKAKLKFRATGWIIVEGDKSILAFGDDMLSAVKALKIIQHYDFDAQCFIGRSDGGGMQYFKSKKGVPSGSYLGEDAIEFDPNLLEVKEIEGRWKVVQGSLLLLDFKASEANARLALETIKRNGFRYQCFVGRPKNPMMYFRK